MYRFRIPEIFLGCFLTVAVFGMGMLFNRQQWQQSGQPQHAERQQESAAQGHKAENPDAELAGSTWLTKDAAGFFTLGLVLVGIGQAFLFLVQLRYMRIGMRDATVAANAARDGAAAARKQAEAMIVAERPYVFLEIIEPGIEMLDGGQIRIAPRRLKYRFVNYGRTPAMLEEVLELYPVIERRSDVPEPVDPLKNRGRLVPVGTISSGDKLKPQAVNLMTAAPDIIKMHEPEAWRLRRIFFQGFVRYSDTFGNNYITGFLAAFSPEHGAWALRGGEQYNYNRQENGKDIPPHPDYPESAQIVR